MRNRGMGHDQRLQGVANTVASGGSGNNTFVGR